MRRQGTGRALAAAAHRSHLRGLSRGYVALVALLIRKAEADAAAEAEKCAAREGVGSVGEQAGVLQTPRRATSALTSRRLCGEGCERASWGVGGCGQKLLEGDGVRM